MMRLVLMGVCIYLGLAVLRPSQDSYLAILGGVVLLMLAGAIGKIFEVK